MLIERESTASDETEENWIAVYRSEEDHFKNQTEIVFKKVKLNFNRLTTGNERHRLRFSVYSKIHENQDGSLYGLYETSVFELKDFNVYSKDMELFNEKSSKHKYGGTLSFDHFQITEQPSFLEYLKNGWFINLSVAIDFTASNGNRHDIVLDDLNEYELAILEIGRILEPYAYKQKFAGFGFGGIPRYQDTDEVSHCFNLNGDVDPTIIGAHQLLEAYRHAA